MERLRLLFVRPGESKAVNRALSESLGLLPPSFLGRDPLERVGRPRCVLASCMNLLAKPFRSWGGCKGPTAGRST